MKQNEKGKTQVRVQLEDNSDYAHPGTLEFSEVTVDQVHLLGNAAAPGCRIQSACYCPGCSSASRSRKGCVRVPCSLHSSGEGHDQRGQANALVVGSDNAGGAARPV